MATALGEFEYPNITPNMIASANLSRSITGTIATHPPSKLLMELREAYVVTRSLDAGPLPALEVGLIA